MGDVGIPTAQRVIRDLKAKIENDKITSVPQVRETMKDIVSGIVWGGSYLSLRTKPSVILVIGVNGVGKTTTIGKLALRLKNQGRKVILGAADTFRAAAIEQLEVWAKRADVELIKHAEGADPASVVFDTIAAGKARSADVIIIDTAGRLHNKKNLMDELNKISRVIERELPDVVEDGDTFEANAALKARSACRVTGLPAIADDSGLCVDYLDGAPGIYSARFSGGHGNDEANNDLLLQKLEGVPMEQRTAYYVCAICCVFPDGEELTVRGECHGHIGFERDGNAGFGYDPLFLVEGRSFGRYTAEEKDKISHRGRALRTLAAELEKRI